MSDSSFDDDDDLILQLAHATQAGPAGEQAPDANYQHQLFRAQGEISILRAQLESLQNSKQTELEKLSQAAHGNQRAAEEHIAALKQTVDKLEDEKKFLGNEIRSLSSAKRRKVAAQGPQELVQQKDHAGVGAGADKTGQNPPEPQVAANYKHHAPPKLEIRDEWSQLCVHIWHYTINGSDRTLLAFLLAISLETRLDVSDTLHIPAKTAVLTVVWELVMTLRPLRLDRAVERLCDALLAMISCLVKRQLTLLPVPFLLSLVHAAVTFKNLAVTQSVVLRLVEDLTVVLEQFLFVLRDDEEDAHYMATQLQQLVNNFILVASLDLLETAATLATQFGAKFVRALWGPSGLRLDLLKQILPENTERFLLAVQINLVYNYVEMLSASLVDDVFAFADEGTNRLIVNSLMKVFLIDIAEKEDFVFYGLNRVLGNNNDFGRISHSVPSKKEDFLQGSTTSLPYPVSKEPVSPKTRFQMALRHDHHLLALRTRIVLLLESLAVSENLGLLNLRENLKSVVRILLFEQNLVMHQPRYRYVYMHLTIISTFVRVFFYILEEHRNINTLIFPETLYEIFVVLMRIAFASDSLSVEAQKFLQHVRKSGILQPGVFNRAVEARSREVAHFNVFDQSAETFAELGNIEGDFANGLEFPYETETIEIAREILSVCVNHDEADNLYYNMNGSQ